MGDAFSRLVPKKEEISGSQSLFGIQSSARCQGLGFHIGAEAQAKGKIVGPGCKVGAVQASHGRDMAVGVGQAQIELSGCQ